MVADAPRALVDDLARFLGMPEFPLNSDDGWHLSLGSDDAYLYCRDGEQMLIVVPVAPLPAEVSWTQMNALLRENLFDSTFVPFRLATDQAGTIVQWGLLRVDELDGASLAEVIGRLGGRAEVLRGMLADGTELAQ